MEPSFRTAYEECDYGTESYRNQRDTSGVSGFLQRFVMLEGGKAWMAWTTLLMAMLLFTALITPYSLAFLVFRLGGPWPISPGLQFMESAVNAVFYVDLFVGFFVSYTDKDGELVVRFSTIARNYAMGMFWVNFFACLPVEAVEVLMGSNAEGETVRALRLARLQKLGRLLRIIRVSARIVKMLSVLGSSKRWMNLRKRISFRVTVAIMFCVFGLLVHIVGCLWYFMAVLHDDEEETWVARRGILGQPPYLQYIASVYFAVTILTTVGFGDINAFTPSEMLCAILMMVMGTLVHSMIMGQIVDFVQKHNGSEVQKEQQKKLIVALAEHAEMDDTVKSATCQWIDSTSRVVRASEDIEPLKSLLLGSAFPRPLIEGMSHTAFGGQLRLNRFVTSGTGFRNPAPFLPLLLAMTCNKRHFEPGQYVYDQCDVATELYLVLGGTFAEVICSGSLCSGNPEQQLDRFDKVVGQALMWVTERTSVSVDSVQLVHILRLWNKGNYFGAVELLLSRQRLCAVRCEAAGSLLVLSKERMLKIMIENPDFERRWRSVAVRRLARFKESIQEQEVFKRPTFRKYKDIAACRIQRWWSSRVHEDQCRSAGTRSAFLAPLRPPARFWSQRSQPAAGAPPTRDQLDRVESRVTGLEGSLARLEKTTERRLSGVEGSLARIEQALAGLKLAPAYLPSSEEETACSRTVSFEGQRRQPRISGVDRASVWEVPEHDFSTRQCSI